MSKSTQRSKSMLVLGLCAMLLPGIAALAQAPPLEPDEPSPATRHAQVIAHGVASMPADEIGWRLTTGRAVPRSRAVAAERQAGFILADRDVVASIDEDGDLLARLAPGEAIWTAPTTLRAAIALDRKPVAYYDIALVSAAEMADGGADAIAGAPFVAPSGDAFDIDLIRDVLNRAEESVVSTGPSPALLLVTSGTVFVASSSGDVSEMTAGNALQVAGDVVVTGASRAPAAVVVARIGPETPARVSLADATPKATPAFIATPVSIATPVITADSASVSISASLCPVAYTGGNYVVDCRAPAAGVELQVMDENEAVASAVADDDGDVAFAGLQPGDYTLSPERSEDFTASRIRCRNVSAGDPALLAETNQIAIALTSGDEVICTWYLVPGEGQGEAPPEPAVPALDEGDVEGDGLTGGREAAPGTDTLLLDSDADGVSDGDEIDFYVTDARDADTDDDGLDDGEELLTYGSNPLLADTDGDGVSDGEEIVAGSNPIDAASIPPTPTLAPTLEPRAEPVLEATPALLATPLATPDAEWDPGLEREKRPDPTSSPKPREDIDGDGLPTVDEIGIYGTDASDADSDGDGFSDGGEVAAGMDPLEPSDG